MPPVGPREKVSGQGFREPPEAENNLKTR